MAILRAVAIRVGLGLVTMLVVSAIIFFATQLLPGNAAKAALGRNATPKAVAVLSKEFGLDRPILQRYAGWLQGVASGNLGNSLPTGVPVSSVIGDKIGNTAALAAVTMVLLIPVGVLFGVGSAIRPGGWLDNSVAGVTLALISTPSFTIASILIVIFSFWLQWLPPVSLVDPSRPLLSRPEILILPVLTLLMGTVAQTIRMIRAGMADVLGSQYVEMARLKGVPEWRVLLFHALPNAVGPTIQILALNIPWLVGGLVVIESIFAYRGLGITLVSAVSSRDLPTVEAIGVIIAGVIIGMNLVADLAVILINPRLRRGG